MKDYARNSSRIRLLLSLVTGVLIISIVILAFTPPTSRDALIHHLAIPKLYLKHGGIYEIPFMAFSYYPMNLNLLYMIPLFMGNDIVPKYIHFIFALLTAWLIYRYLRRRLNSIYGLLGAVFFLSIPIIVKLSITAYVDLGVVFFSTASLLLLLRWIETRFPMRYLILSGIFCGLAVGTKYNGLIALLLLTLFIPYLYSRCAQQGEPRFFKAVGFGVIFLMVALAVFSPWMIRNYVWTHNPVFPLYDHWFNPQGGYSRASMGLFTVRSVMYHENWWQIALLPVRVFFQGQDGNPQYFDGKLNAFLLLLPLVVLYQIRGGSRIIRTEKGILFAFAGLFFLFALFTSTLRMRYIAPIIPPLVILSVFGIESLSRVAANFARPISRAIGKGAVLVIVLCLLWLNANYIFDQYREVRPFHYLGGRLTRDEYIETYRPEYPVMQYINTNLPPDVRILFIFMGNRGYYCEREYIFDMSKNKSMFQQFVKLSTTTEELLLRLQSLGITHLLVYYDIFDRWMKDAFTVEEQGFLKRFFQIHVKHLYVKNGYGISRLEAP